MLAGFPDGQHQGVVMNITSQVANVGGFSFATGFTPARTNLFDEIRQNPEAVRNRLVRAGQEELAERLLGSVRQARDAKK